MITIDDKLLFSIINKAKSNNRKRQNYNFHEQYDDLLQRMLNALEPRSYVQPHRHLNPDKREVFIILSGRMLVVTFDDNGNRINHVVFDPKEGKYAVEIPVGEWHMIAALEENTVVYEIKDGPYYQETDKNFAPWAPKESDADAAQGYLDSVLDKIGV